MRGCWHSTGAFPSLYWVCLQSFVSGGNIFNMHFLLKAFLFLLTSVTFHLSSGAIPFSIGCYAVHMNLDKLWQEPSFRFTPLQNFINGCLAAGVAQTLSYPFETVKRKMQVICHRITSLFARRFGLIGELKQTFFKK